MKNQTNLSFLIILGLLCSAFTILIPNWNIDTHYSIKFSGSKAEGTFSGLKGIIQFDPNNLTSSLIDVEVDANTIKTGNSTKDAHAKGESWFNTSEFPKIKFKSKTFTKSNNTWFVSGILDLHGVKNEILIPFAFIENGNEATFKGKFKVNRKDFGINGNAMGFMVGNEFEVSLVIPVTK